MKKAIKTFVPRTDKQQTAYEKSEKAPSLQAAETSKKLSRFAFIALGMTFLAIGVFIYWYIYPYKVLDIKYTPVSVRPTIISDNTYIVAHFDYCKSTNSRGVNDIAIVSIKTQISLPESIDTLPVGCHVVDVPLPIPLQAEPDTYHFHFHVVYQVNPIRTIMQDFDTKEFKILGQPKQPVVKLK